VPQKFIAYLYIAVNFWPGSINQVRTQIGDVPKWDKNYQAAIFLQREEKHKFRTK
jgi:hypothetical protein